MNLQLKYLYMNASYSGRLDVELYVDMYREWLKLMSHLGSAIKMGFRSIEENIRHFLRNRDIMVDLGFITKDDLEYTDLLAFCDLETSLGIEAMNEATNDDILQSIYLK